MIVHEAQGPTRNILQNCCRNPSDAFKIFLTPSIVSTIVECTNKEGALQMEIWQDIDSDELNVFFALLLLIGAYKEINSSIFELWSQEDGRNIFKNSLSLNRFTDLLCCIRFDIRSERYSKDKFSPIRKIFELIVTKFRSSYRPSST